MGLIPAQRPGTPLATGCGAKHHRHVKTLNSTADAVKADFRWAEADLTPRGDRRSTVTELMCSSRDKRMARYINVMQSRVKNPFVELATG